MKELTIPDNEIPSLGFLRRKMESVNIHIFKYREDFYDTYFDIKNNIISVEEYSKHIKVKKTVLSMKKIIIK